MALAVKDGLWLGEGVCSAVEVEALFAPSAEDEKAREMEGEPVEVEERDKEGVTLEPKDSEGHWLADVAEEGEKEAEGVLPPTDTVGATAEKLLELVARGEREIEADLEGEEEAKGLALTVPPPREGVEPVVGDAWVETDAKPDLVVL